MATATVDRTEALEAKVDALTEQVAFLVDQAELQAKRRRQWEDLSRDAMPLAKTGMERLSAELEETALDPEAVLDLARRLAANVENMERLLVALESGVEFADDAKDLLTEGMAMATARLEELDRKGYFTFIEAGLGVVDRVVTNFSEEDVNQLADNVVLILETVKELTQPELMAVVARMVRAVERERLAMEASPAEAPSLWQLAGTMRDPEVRLGMGRALATLRAVSTVETAVQTQDQAEDNDTEGGA